MTAPELKPCPFCGRAMEITDDLRHYNHPMSACFGRHIGIAASDIDRIEMWNRRADLAAVQPMQGVWNKCTFDLIGDGYDCAIKDGDARHGAYGEGQKVFWDGTTINAEGLYILSNPALDKRIAAAQLAQARVKPTDAQINSACLSYRHDFGLMTKRNQDDLRFQANEWLIAWQKETRILPTIEPQPDPRVAGYDQAYQYALTLADVLMAKHYPDNKDWQPLGDLTGLLTQIDNMVNGKMPDPRDEVIARLVEALRNCDGGLGALGVPRDAEPRSTARTSLAAAKAVMK